MVLTVGSLQEATASQVCQERWLAVIGPLAVEGEGWSNQFVLPGDSLGLPCHSSEAKESLLKAWHSGLLFEEQLQPGIPKEDEVFFTVP